MFTQFFGNYLLNKQLVSTEHLTDALQKLSTTKLKLGVLAINAGILTAEQVELVHAEQLSVDKRIGDIIIDMGFATKDQIEELFKTQPLGHLLLGQALVDSGYMSNAQFEQAFKSYKEENCISDNAILDDDDIVNKLISKFYSVSNPNVSKYMLGYSSLLFRNLIRFIGDDFAPMEYAENTGYECKNCITQKLLGELSTITIIEADNKAMINLASRFANEELYEYDEYSQAVVSEFLNLHNGLFAVNYSDEESVEFTLEPQEYFDSLNISSSDNAYIIPIRYPFGTVKFIISFIS